MPGPAPAAGWVGDVRGAGALMGGVDAPVVVGEFLPNHVLIPPCAEHASIFTVTWEYEPSTHCAVALAIDAAEGAGLAVGAVLGAGAGADIGGADELAPIHVFTPPCLVHALASVFACEYEPSLQIAEAPAIDAAEGLCLATGAAAGAVAGALGAEAGGAD